MNESRVVIVIPAYNCEHTIAKVVLGAKNYGIVMVCDDGSKDMTKDIAYLCAHDVICHKINEGKGGALKTLINYAREKYNPEILITMDADDQHDASYIPLLVAPIFEGSDVVIGSREGKDIVRRFGGKILDFFSPKNVSLDFQSGFRAYDHRALDVLEIKTKGFGVDQQILEDMIKNGMKISQISIKTRYDKFSHTKNPFSHFLEVLENIFYRKPLMTYGSFGVVISLIGAYFIREAIIVWMIYEELAFGKLILGTMSVILGVLSIFTGLILHVLCKNLKV